MNIYFTSYHYFCGRYEALIIAKDEKKAAQFFAECFKNRVPDVIDEIGKAKRGEKPRVLMSKDIY